MIHLTKRTLNDLFTGPDGVTFAIGRVSGAVALISGLALPFVAVFKGQTINFTDLGVYFGGLAGGVTALITVTNKTEPPPPPGG